MKREYYSVYDKVAQIFNPPYEAVNTNTAIRAFMQLCNGNPNQEDFELYRVYSFDDNNGETVPEKSPVKIITGFDLNKE